MKTWVTVLLAAILGLGTLTAGPVAAQASSANDMTSRATAGSAAEAVRRSVEATGGTYAGDCASTRSPDDIGHICSKLVASKDGISAFETGRTFSEFNTWVFVVQSGDSWCVLGTAPLDDSPASPGIPWPAVSSTAGC